MRRVSLGLFVTLAFVAGACSGGGDDASAGDRAKPEAGEVFLDALSAVGPSPFTHSVAVAPVPAVAATAASSGNTQGLRSVRGTTADLYGASASLQACDTVGGVESLIVNNDKAQAWVDALNDDADLSWSGGAKLAVEDVTAYAAELTAVFLLSDTRVTNYGYRDGAAFAYQAVLQRGSAVLIDAQGVPRVRCAAFSPLIPPQPAASPKYRGEEWDGFDKTKLVTVQPGATVESFRVTDVHAKRTIEIAVGRTCACTTTLASTTTTTLFDDETTTTTPASGRTTTTQRRVTPTTVRPTTTTAAPTTTVPPTTVPPTTTPPTTA